MKNLYGKKGKQWLDDLPKLIEGTEIKYGLSNLKPVKNLSYSYVLSGFQGDVPIMLKFSLDSAGLKREASALRCFSGLGAVKVIAEDKQLLLLARAIPGLSLKNHFPAEDRDAVEIACNIMKKLHQAEIPKNHNFPHIRDWLSSLDKNWEIPAHYLQKARKLRDQLLREGDHDVLLHGDLHHDNILKNGDAWVVIDPKGVIGEPIYEVAAFIRNPISDLLAQENAAHIIQSRIHIVASLLDMSVDSIANWCFVQAILAWIWALEDGCEADYWQGMVRVLDGM